MSFLLNKLNPTPYFPEYTGPYDVGTLDIKLPASYLVNSGLSPPAPKHTNGEISTVQFRVFYPASLKGQAAKNLPNVRPVRWLPSPRREYVAAYARFLGAKPFWANVMSYVPRILEYITIPIVAGHPILDSGIHGEHTVPEKFPTMVFSHGLGGTRNGYSHLIGSIASQGAVVFSIEHRDGSAPTTFIRQPTGTEGVPSHKSDGIDDTPPSSVASSTSSREQSQERSSINEDTTTKDAIKPILTKSGKIWKRIDYISQSHELSETTSAMRNKQFEIRFWELGLLYGVIQKLNSGWSSSDTNEDMHVNPQDKLSKEKVSTFLQMFKSRLNVENPGSITWMGHSFGAATITQFVKSVWYYPKLASSSFDPLYTPGQSLLSHFHPEDKSTEKAPTVIILDLWILPLLGNRTRALWQLPLPGPAMGILSQEFFVWKDNLRGNRHVLSLAGGGKDRAFGNLQEENNEGKKGENNDEIIPQLKKSKRSQSMDITPEIPGGLVGDESSMAAAMVDDHDRSNSSSTVSKPTTSSISTSTSPDRKLFYAPGSAHLSQSDFGVLFPRMVKALAKVENAERTLSYNSRAVVEFIREQGQPVAGRQDDGIFDGEVEGWLKVDLDVDAKDGKKVAEKVAVQKEEQIENDKDARL